MGKELIATLGPGRVHIRNHNNLTSDMLLSASGKATIPLMGASEEGTDTGASDMPTTASEISRAVLALKQSEKLTLRLRRLSIEETDVVIVIHGRVGTYYLKQLAQETVMPVRGNRQLVNHVSVGRD